MTRLLFLVIIISTFTSCTRPGDYPISQTCEWTESDSRPLDLTTYADRRHLRFDAITAEDMAIRWADQHFGLQPQWDQRCDDCMQTLFAGLAQNHSVDVATVRRYSRERDMLIDVPMIIGFALIYAAVAYIFAGRIRRRFPPGEPGFWVMALTMASGISLVGVLIGMVSTIIIEMYRLSPHLSFRMNRLPFRAHWVIFFVGGVIIFIFTAMLRYYRKQDAPVDSQSFSLKGLSDSPDSI